MVRAILTLGSLYVVIYLITVVQLTPVKQFLTRYGIIGIETLKSTLLVLVGFARQRFLPVQVGLHGLTILIFLNLVGLVATVCGVCQTLT